MGGEASLHVRNKASGLLRAEGVQRVGWGAGEGFWSALTRHLKRDAEDAGQAGVRFQLRVSLVPVSNFRTADGTSPRSNPARIQRPENPVL